MTFSCIRRNPTKGIERTLNRWPGYTAAKILVVAFEEIPQRELRVNYFNATQTPPPPQCCIRRNPTKGIESHQLSLGPRSLEVCPVAFEEIPQRELRDQKPSWVDACGYHGFSVAFEEIPQRELRGKQISSTIQARPSCIRRNPTKGIESHISDSTLGDDKPSLSCIRRNPTKGIESSLQFSHCEF